MIAINGQTGKTDGYLPVDRVKRRMRLIGHRLVDALLVILTVAVFAAFLFGLYYLGISFIGSSAGHMFLLCGVLFASPMLALLIMGYRVNFNIGGKLEPVAELLTRPVRKLSDKRSDSYRKLRNETNMVVGSRPSADEYYYSRAKIEFDNSEFFSNAEM